MFGCGSHHQWTEPMLSFHCEPPLLYVSVQYCWPTATNTDVKHTHKLYPVVFLYYPGWSITSRQNRRVCSQNQPGGTFLFNNGRKWNARCAVFGEVSIHSAAMIVSTVHLQLLNTVNLNILVIYRQLFISAVTHALLSDCIAAHRQMMDFSVSSARFLFCAWNHTHILHVFVSDKVILYFLFLLLLFLQFYLLFWIIFPHCLFGRLACCVWAVGVENDKEWEKEWEGWQSALRPC